MIRLALRTLFLGLVGTAVGLGIVLNVSVANGHTLDEALVAVSGGLLWSVGAASALAVWDGVWEWRVRRQRKR